MASLSHWIFYPILVVLGTAIGYFLNDRPYATLAIKYRDYKVMPWPSLTNKSWWLVVCMGLVMALSLALTPTPAMQWSLVLLLPLSWLIIRFDLEHQLIPDRCNIALFVISFISAAFLIDHQTLLTNSIVGIVSGLVLWGTTVAYEKIRKKSALGMGDMKLLVAVSPYFGFDLVTVLCVGCILCAVVIAFKKMRRQQTATTFAFAPYLLISVIINLLVQF